MGAVMQEGARGRKWRCLTISDARLRRRNFLYSLPTELLSAAAPVVAKELKETARALVGNDVWPGFEKFPRERSRAREKLNACRPAHAYTSSPKPAQPSIAAGSAAGWGEQLICSPLPLA